MDILSLYKATGPVAKTVLLVLLGFSLYSWAIIAAKYFFLKKVKSQNRRFHYWFKRAKNLSEVETLARRDSCMLAEIFLSGYNAVRRKRVVSLEGLERELYKSSSQEIEKLEAYLSFLAITASSAPFIGLFGTVWGIMNSFREIGIKKTASLVAVAPGIAEALITTAAGLFAAVPAVIAYNYFSSQIKQISNEVDGFIMEVINLIEANLERNEEKKV